MQKGLIAVVVLLTAGFVAGGCTRRQENAPPQAGQAPATEPAATPTAAPEAPPPASAQPATAPAPAPPASARTPSRVAPQPAPAPAGATAMPEAPAAPPAPPEPEYREVTIPAGTTISATLETAVSSDKSAVEDPVRARLRSSLRADGVTAIPAGARLSGVVTEAAASGKVKGRARVAFRFSRLTSGDESYDIATSSVAREAQSTKGKDAKKIGVGTGAGALIGAIAGGGKGAAIGAGVGAAAGTGVVMATKGDEVRLEPGTPVTVELSAPLTVRVLIKP